MVAFIRNYGLLWSLDLVNWGRRGPGGRGSLIGVPSTGNKTKVDFWDQRGVYLLHEGVRTVYVGKARNMALGDELRQRRRTHGGAWDRFSWFGVRFANKNGTLSEFPERLNCRANDVIDSFEAVLIHVVNPELNKRDEKMAPLEYLQQGAEEELTNGQMMRRMLETLERIEKHIQPSG